MPFINSASLAFVIRLAHVAGLALMLGGALLLWAGAVRLALPAGPGTRPLLFSLAERYEYAFWLALGLQVITGIGNLGALGAGLPEPASAWGGRLSLKLGVVVVLFLWSVLRTFIVARWSGDLTPGRVQWLYGLTAGLLAVIAWLAVALAHG